MTLIKRLLVSFSGGETSALMCHIIKSQLRHEYDEIIYVFANTGQENEETLAFVERVDKAFGLGVVWVEGVFNPEKGKGVTAKVVDFLSASRDGRPFEEMIRKFGIPNPVAPFCSKELKGQVITAYARSIGWKTGSYDLAIGIRADEVDRISDNAKERRIIYPLITRFRRTKPMVNMFWETQPFRLNLKGYQGNCKWCWKKSLRKHLTIITETPEAYDFPERMEAEHGHRRKQGEGRVVFFRNETSVSDLRKMAKEKPFVPATDDAREYQVDLIDLIDADIDQCGGSSCEVEF